MSDFRDVMSHDIIIELIVRSWSALVLMSLPRLRGEDLRCRYGTLPCVNAVSFFLTFVYLHNDISCILLCQIVKLGLACLT